MINKRVGEQGARGLTVIVVENSHGYRVQIFNQAVCILHSVNTFGEGMNLPIRSPAMGKYYGNWLINLGKATSLGEGKL